MERQDLLAQAKQDPRFQQAADQVTARLVQSGVSAEMLDQMAEVIEYALEHPDSYPQLRAHAIQKGVAQEKDLPPEFNAQFLTIMLLAIYDAEEQLGNAPPEEQEQFACGGLAKHGRGGDTMLAHINSREAEVLRRMGGSGTVNPNTGVREFKGGGFSDIVSIVAPVALDFIAPGMGSALGLGSIGTGALASGIAAGLTGGDIGKAALGGALGGGLGNAVGGWAGDLVGGLSDKASGVLGNALVGGVGGALQGKGFGAGAMQGVTGSLMGGALGNIATGDGAIAQGLRSAGSTFGNALTAGYSPKEAITGGALAGLASGLAARGKAPVETVDAATSQSGPVGRGPNSTKVISSIDAPLSTPEAGMFGTGIDSAKAIAATPLLFTMLSQAETPEQVQQAASSMSPQQREYFNRASQSWDWGQMQRDAAASGQSLGSYMARNLPNITAQGQYVKKASGGLLALAEGGGSGRDDTINARLSDGEFVVDAETVAMLGDGSTKEGARRLDEMRAQIRQHKGKALSKGKISPNAKSPLSYLKEAA